MCSDRPPGGRGRSSLYVDSTPGQPTRALSPLLPLALAVICLEACEPLRTRGPVAAHPTLPSAVSGTVSGVHMCGMVHHVTPHSVNWLRLNAGSPAGAAARCLTGVANLGNCGAIAIIVLALVADEDLGVAHADDEALGLGKSCTSIGTILRSGAVA